MNTTIVICLLAVIALQMINTFLRVNEYLWKKEERTLLNEAHETMNNCSYNNELLDKIMSVGQNINANFISFKKELDELKTLIYTVLKNPIL